MTVYHCHAVLRVNSCNFPLIKLNNFTDFSGCSDHMKLELTSFYVIKFKFFTAWLISSFSLIFCVANALKRSNARMYG